MENLWLLLIVSLGLLTCNMIFSVSNQKSSDDPQVCACDCSSDGMTFPEMTSNVRYKGLTRNASTCNCEDFLAPKLHRYVLASHNETCEHCKCNVEFNVECEDGHPTFFAQFQIASYTTVCLTFGLFLVNAVAYWFYFRCQNAQRRKGYQRISDSEIGKGQRFPLSNQELSQRVEELSKENLALKMKFNSLEKKVSISKHLNIPKHKFTS